MEYFFRFEQPSYAFFALACIAVAIGLRRIFHTSIRFRYSLGSHLIEDRKESTHSYAAILYFLRLMICCVLALLIGKPQLVDSRSNTIVDGIDIVVTLDVSGSMDSRDYGDDDRSRFDIAKQEAIRFINKRPNDAIGLVLFGNAALARCPVTMDKKVLVSLLEKLELGEIDHQGTLLARGLITAINRLKSSEAKSKIIILLTDGEPSPGDIDPAVAIEIAKKFDIKIYTIGIGSLEDEEMFHPFYGRIVQRPKINEALLKEIARQTDGNYFLAQNEKDMRAIYDTIDQLETTKHDAPLYSRYFDIYGWITIALLGMILCGQLLQATVWFSI